MNVIDVLQKAQEVALLEKAKLQVRASGPPRWKPKVVWLHNPAAMCPWCDQWVATRRVWALREKPMAVLGVWDAAGRRLPMAHMVHPHVFSHGGICNGDAGAPLMDALWAGLNPFSPASGGSDAVKLWLRELGHSCENLGDKRRLGSRFQRVVEREIEEEEEDHEGESYCESCDEWYDENEVYSCDNLDGYYCESCFDEMHRRCEDCGEEVCNHGRHRHSTYTVTDGSYDKEVCESCYSDNYFTCEECDVAMSTDEHQEDSTCKECWAASHADCELCDQEFERDELNDGVCSECQAEQVRQEEEEVESGDRDNSEV